MVEVECTKGRIDMCAKFYRMAERKGLSVVYEIFLLYGNYNRNKRG